MKPAIFSSILFCFLFFSCQTNTEEKPVSSIPKNEQLEAGNPGAKMVKEMIDALGGLEAYYQLQDVEYTYYYRNPESGQEDVSLERYIYDGEKSWAEYTKHDYRMMPDKEGVVIQSYDGKNTWVTLNGEKVEVPKIVKMADFNRKTNFYWLNMFPKLLDPGTRFEKKENRMMNDINYEMVEVSFGENIGDAQDKYLLYINPETKLVDQFLFTVMDFGRAEPLLMEVKYEEVSGIKWPTYRRYAPANWEGELAEDYVWIEEISENLKFNNGFDESLFSAN